MRWRTRSDHQVVLESLSIDELKMCLQHFQTTNQKHYMSILSTVTMYWDNLIINELNKRVIDNRDNKLNDLGIHEN
jgi:hypothetical protein